MALYRCTLTSIQNLQYIMEIIDNNLQQTIIGLLSKHANIPEDQVGILDMELKTLGLSSLDIIKVFVGLEKGGHLDLSSLGNNEPPRTINEIIQLCNNSN